MRVHIHDILRPARNLLVGFVWNLARFRNFTKMCEALFEIKRIEL